MITVYRKLLVLFLVVGFNVIFIDLYKFIPQAIFNYDTSLPDTDNEKALNMLSRIA